MEMFDTKSRNMSKINWEFGVKLKLENKEFQRSMLWAYPQIRFSWKDRWSQRFLVIEFWNYWAALLAMMIIEQTIVVVVHMILFDPRFRRVYSREKHDDYQKNWFDICPCLSSLVMFFMLGKLPRGTPFGAKRRRGDTVREKTSVGTVSNSCNHRLGMLICCLSIKQS